MDRAHLSKWFFPVLVVFVHLTALLSVLGEHIFFPAANGFVVFLGESIMREERGSDWSAIARDLETWSGPAVRTLTTVCGGLVAFAMVVLLRQRKGGDAPRLQPIFWGCTIVWAYLILAGTLFNAYYYELVRKNFHYDHSGWRSFLMAHLSQRGFLLFIYPAVLLMISWLATWNPRRRFIGAETVAAIHHLRAESGGVHSIKALGQEGVAPVSPDRRARLHPSLGVLVLSLLVIWNYRECVLYSPAALLSPLVFGKLGILVAETMPLLSDNLEGLAYIIAIVGWGAVLLSALFLSGRSLADRQDDLPFERLYWVGVRLWAYLFLIGMCLFPGMPGGSDIYPTPILLILPLGMLCFAWLGERRMRKHAITPDQTAATSGAAG